jgi:uncharacterized protein
MSEAHKQTVVRFLNALGSGDAATMDQLLTDDAAVVTPGTASICGTRNRDVIMMLTRDTFPKVTKAGITFKVINLTAESDRVACEAEGYSTMTNGKAYNNTYHFLFTFRDGKIRSIKEYLDTKLAEDVLGPYLVSQ